MQPEASNDVLESVVIKKEIDEDQVDQENSESNIVQNIKSKTKLHSEASNDMRDCVEIKEEIVGDPLCQETSKVVKKENIKLKKKIQSKDSNDTLDSVGIKIEVYEESLGQENSRCDDHKAVFENVNIKIEKDELVSGKTTCEEINTVDSLKVKKEENLQEIFNKQDKKPVKRKLRKPPDGPKKCEPCNKIFTNRRNYTRHYNRCHIEHKLSYKCSKCDRTYKSPQPLKVHELSHSGIEVHKCDVCGKGFMSKYNLNVHLEGHSSENKYLCDICAKSFKTLSYFMSHQQRHSKRFKCAHCGYTTAKNCLLKFHMDVCEKKAFSGTNSICKICQEEFPTRDEMKLHRKVHGTTCPVCQKTFNRRVYLEKHVALHSDFLRYQCDLCGKRFRDNGNFSVHRRSHNEQRKRLRRKKS